MMKQQNIPLIISEKSIQKFKQENKNELVPHCKRKTIELSFFSTQSFSTKRNFSETDYSREAT